MTNIFDVQIRYSIRDICHHAAGLLDPDEQDHNTEYLRGMSELVARCVQIATGEDTGEIAERARAKILSLPLG